MKLSRNDQVDIGAIRELGNIYDTIIELSARVYRLRAGAMPAIPDYGDPFNTGVITSLIEKQTGAYNGLQ